MIDVAFPLFRKLNYFTQSYQNNSRNDKIYCFCLGFVCHDGNIITFKNYFSFSRVLYITSLYL